MIKEYIKKDGTRAYMFKVYLGKDMLTGKERHTTRRGFKTRREARLELAKFKHKLMKIVCYTIKI